MCIQAGPFGPSAKEPDLLGPSPALGESPRSRSHRRAVDLFKTRSLLLFLGHGRV